MVCLGEALALVPALPTAGTVPDPATAHLAGAEANVAAGLAAAGVPAAWVGRLGTDPLGEFLLAELRARGVETGGVQLDPDRPDRLLRQGDRAGRPRAAHPDALPPRRIRGLGDGPGLPGRPAVAARLDRRPARAHQRHHRRPLRLVRRADAHPARPPAPRPAVVRRELARADVAGRRPGAGRRAGRAGRPGAGRRGRGAPGVRHRRPGRAASAAPPTPAGW